MPRAGSTTKYPQVQNHIARTTQPRDHRRVTGGTSVSLLPGVSVTCTADPAVSGEPNRSARALSYCLCPLNTFLHSLGPHQLSRGHALAKPWRLRVALKRDD
jgi:hypothetical protein